MYAIKTRSGGVYLRMKALNGTCGGARATAALGRSSEVAPPQRDACVCGALTRVWLCLMSVRAGDLSAFEKDENSLFTKARARGHTHRPSHHAHAPRKPSLFPSRPRNTTHVFPLFRHFRSATAATTGRARRSCSAATTSSARRHAPTPTHPRAQRASATTLTHYPPPSSCLSLSQPLLPLAQLEKKRTVMFNEAIGLFNDKKFEEALIVFENIVGLEPKNYIGDNFEKVTSIFRVAQYNIACCYSCLGSVEPGLEALQVAMSVGFDDFGKIRKDPSLKTLQAAEGFKKLLDKVRACLRGRAACVDGCGCVCGCVC
jgi:hypothetical protein